MPESMWINTARTLASNGSTRTTRYSTEIARAESSATKAHRLTVGALRENARTTPLLNLLEAAKPWIGALIRASKYKVI